MANGNEGPIFKGLNAGIGKDSLPPGYYTDFRNIDLFVFNVARQRAGLTRVTLDDDVKTLPNPIVSMASMKVYGKLNYFAMDRGGILYRYTGIGKDS